MGKLGCGVATILISMSQFALAHGGGLNAEGCHNNRKTGDYHCHRAPAPRANLSPAPVQPAGTSNAGVSAVPSTAKPSLGSTCYVGPRGGTYTITKSGRKNYGGC